MARRLMMDLASRLVMPKPHESDAHAHQRPEHSQAVQSRRTASRAYPEAVDLAFDPCVEYGILIKDYRSHELPDCCSPGEIVAAVRRRPGGDRPRLSHVERHNLTVRTFMRRFTRRTFGFSKKAWRTWPRWQCLWPASLYVAGPVVRQERPAARDSGEGGRPVNTLWTVEDRFREVIGR
jgi:hypothetical protein